MADIQSDNADSPSRDTAGTRLAAKRAAKAARKAASRGASASVIEDTANSTALEATAWMDKHGGKILLGIGAALAIAVVGLLISNASESKNREAGALLESAVRSAQGIVVPPEETQPEEPLFPVFPSVKEREDKALAQFKAVTKQFPESLAATYAQLGEANAQLRLGQYDQAGTIFEKLRKQSGDNTDDFVRFRATEGAGYALEGQQKYAEARERFEALSQLNNGAYRTLGDYHRARMLVAEGKRDEAKKLLEGLSKAAADRPEAAGAEAATADFESTMNAAQTLLVELGGAPPERPGSASGISQQVLDSLRKQLGSQSSAGPGE